MTNTKSTKRALISSAMALFLCFAMLLGTTFAWFTDSAASATNKIVAGNLDVELYHTNGTDTDEPVTTTTTLFDEVDLWEPGAMVWEKLTVKNLGSLALKYILTVNVSDISVVNGKSLADVLQVAVMTEQPTRDNIVTAEKQALETFTLKNDGVLAAKTGVDEFYVAIYWAPTANDNDYNVAGEQLYANLGVTLLATQATVEKDAFNDQYDKDATYPEIWDGTTVTTPVADANGVYHISTAAELVGMMEVTGNSIYYGKTIVLENNIDLAGRTVKGIGSDSTNFAGVFDGQGYTISNFKIDATDREYYAGLFNQVSHGGTVKNLTVKNATVIGNSMVGAVASSVDSGAVIDNCKAIDCTVSGVKKVGSVIGYSAGGTVTNNYAENCDVLYSEKEGGEILGYENTSSTVKDNTSKNVEVVNGYAIFNEEELVALGGTKINGTYVLLADLDMAGYEMKSMEISGGANVTFLGNDHSISNLKLSAANINGMTGSDNEVAGLFDMTAPATTVSLTVNDLVVSDIEVSCDGYAAAIVGYNSNGGSTITLNNVDVKGATVTADTVAALVGYSTGAVKLTNCDISNISLTGETNRPEKVGAYIGTANSSTCVVTVSNCTNNTSYNNVGRTINGATYN